MPKNSACRPNGTAIFMFQLGCGGLDQREAVTAAMKRSLCLQEGRFNAPQTFTGLKFSPPNALEYEWKLKSFISSADSEDQFACIIRGVEIPEATGVPDHGAEFILSQVDELSDFRLIKNKTVADVHAKLQSGWLPWQDYPKAETPPESGWLHSMEQVLPNFGAA